MQTLRQEPQETTHQEPENIDPWIVIGPSADRVMPNSDTGSTEIMYKAALLLQD